MSPATRNGNGTATVGAQRQLDAIRRGVRRRAVSVRALLLLPLVAGWALVASRYWGVGASAVGAALLAVAAAAWIRHGLRVYEGRWLIRRLNALVPALEDSADLLVGSRLAATSHGAGLSALQVTRLTARLNDVPLPELRPPYPRRALAITWGVALLATGAALLAPSLWQRLPTFSAAGTPSSGNAAIKGALRITPPTYTHLPTQDLDSLDAKVPEGSRVAFAVHPGAKVSAAALAFHDGSRLVLHPDGETWRGERTVDSSTLYRLHLDADNHSGTEDLPAADRLHRLDVLADQPPELIVRTPDHTLNLLAKGQKTWDLVFEARDDYGLGPAQLSIAHAQGSGENIKTTQQMLVLEGDGDERHRTYRRTLDLAALGFAEGDDLIVRVSVADNRPGHPNIIQSASFILRWPAQIETASSGMEGLVQKTLPAYFASERQIIIDSEALQAQRDHLEAKRFAARADELGVEQKVLRLRYGEFLGEESEHSAQHDDDTASTSKSFGDAGNLTSEYGHVHDRREAATLLDPDTRRILKAALDEMWQAELHLRQADPDLALPYEYKALDYIKQVQQAERIYLARAGVQLPQVDASRRLTGDRAGLSDRDIAPPDTVPDESPIAAIWQSLNGDEAPDWPRLTTWTRQHQNTLPDALGLLAAADRVQHDPACARCRTELANMLWPLLPPARAALEPRRLPDASGAAYLQALGVASQAASPLRSTPPQATAPQATAPQATPPPLAPPQAMPPPLAPAPARQTQ
jgi:hypothetical protein